MTLPYRYRKQLIVISTIILLLIVGGGTTYYYTSNKPNKDLTTKTFVLAANEKEKKQEEKTVLKIKVDIKGSINAPGLYEIEDGLRVQDVITLAGGLLESADTSLINLGKKVSDEMVIIIYSKEEITAYLKTKEQEKEKLTICNCDKEVINDACIDNKEEPKELTKVSLNKGTIENFMTLPGIGESKAKEIIEYRNSKGLFKKIEDIMKIPGIKENVFAKIKDQLTI
ncbi:MAG: helix-hairpin-helix domain-containing protein [Bacilli bacterium]